jgi:hypothetical protein
MPHKQWDEDTYKDVLHMLDAGMTQRAIARHYGISRNAAIGRIARDPVLHSHLGRVAKKKPKPKVAKRVAPPKKPPPTPPEPPKKKTPLGPMRLVPMKDLAQGECRWPVQEADVIGGHLFCGRRVAGFDIYCAEHMRASYRDWER